MDSVAEMLRAFKVPQERIKRESFGAAEGSQHTKEPVPEQVCTAEFVRSRTVSDVSPGETLLEAAERTGVQIPFSCRQGQCGTCATRLLQGQVDMRAEEGLSSEQKEAGFALMCVAHPRGNVRVDA